jgi:manganese/zinc/iron transport system permease protein
MNWSSLDTWIVIAGVLSAVSCALLGNFMVLQRMSMMGDAISHAVLPGLAAAFLLTGSRDSITMFVGAAIVGVLTALFTQWIHKLGQVEESAAMGVVFTSLFAVGLILIVRGANKVDLDPGCVLYGAIELVPLDTKMIFGHAIPRAVVNLSVVFVLNALFVFLFFKELKIAAFDPSLATTLGINASFMHYALMTLVAVTTVAAFETVGSILVIAMLIVPAAAAHLLTDRLHSMIFVSLIIAVLCAVLGHVAAITVPGWFGFTDTSTAGMMAVVAGAIFAVVFFAAPRYGLVSKLLHRALLSVRIVREDVLGLLYRFEEFNTALTSAHLRGTLLAGPLLRGWAVHGLARAGKIQHAGDTLVLTDSGRQEARGLVRTHRLWESYLEKHLKLPADHVHPTAERLEHITSPAMQEELAETTGRPESDPHGKKVPQ